MRLSPTGLYFSRLAGLSVLSFLASNCSSPQLSGSTGTGGSGPLSVGQVADEVAMPVAAGDDRPRVILLYAADLHGRLRPDDGGLGGYARLATYVKDVKTHVGPRTDVYAIVGGDVVGKSALPCRQTGEKACVKFLADMGFDLAVLGNGELKRSAQELNELIQLSGVKWISANVSSAGAAWSPHWSVDAPKSSAKLFFASWTVPPAPGEIDLKKAKLTVKETPSDADWAHWKKAAAGRSIVWLPHQEMAQDKEFLTRACAETSLRNVVLLKANDHVQGESRDLCAPIFAPAPFGQSVSRVVLQPNEQGVWSVYSQDFVTIDRSFGEDREIKTAIENLYREIAPQADDVVATADRDLSAEQFAKWVGRSFRKVTRADIAIVNLGAVKESIRAGALSREELALVYPYRDEIMGLDWSAKDLERSLCESSRRARDPLEDYGSELVLEGAELQHPGTPECKLDGPKRASYKVALVSYLVKRSKRWLGKEIQSTSFKFQVTTDQAFEKMLKDSGKRL